MPQPMMALGWAVAYISAALCMVAGSTPVMSATFSGVYSLMVSHHWSKPSVCCAMKSLSA